MLYTFSPFFIVIGQSSWIKSESINHVLNKHRKYRGGNQNGQSREPDNIRYTRRQTNQKHNAMCVGHHYAQVNTINVNKT